MSISNGTQNRTDSNERKSHETVHPLYVIYSRWSFSNIMGLLSRYTSNPDSDIGSLKVDYDSNGADTNRSFVLLTDNVVAGLTDDNFDKPNRLGLSFSKYRIRDDFKLDNRSLCVPIPRDLKLSGTEVKSLVEDKLKEAIRFGVISSSEFKVNVPLHSREADIPKNACYIGFSDSISDETINVIRALLHNTYWETESDEPFIFNCHFARNTSSNRSQEPKEKTFYRHEQKTTEKQDTKEQDSSSKRQNSSKGRTDWQKK